jgi:uncharacterized membrane protein
MTTGTPIMPFALSFFYFLLFYLFLNANGVTEFLHRPYSFIVFNESFISDCIPSNFRMINY